MQSELVRFVLVIFLNIAFPFYQLNFFWLINPTTVSEKICFPIVFHLTIILDSYVTIQKRRYLINAVRIISPRRGLKTNINFIHILPSQLKQIMCTLIFPLIITHLSKNRSWHFNRVNLPRKSFRQHTRFTPKIDIKKSRPNKTIHIFKSFTKSISNEIVFRHIFSLHATCCWCTSILNFNTNEIKPCHRFVPKNTV